MTASVDSAGGLFLAFDAAGTDDVLLPPGRFRIGGSDGQDLAHHSLAAEHAVLISLPRRLELRVSAPTWVNGRQVAAKALVYPGDTLRFGELTARVVQESPSTPSVASPLVFGGQQVLRSLSGLEAGSAKPMAAVFPSGQLIAKQGELRFSLPASIQLNGRWLREGRLTAGDQLTINSQRWRLESAHWIPQTAADTVNKPVVVQTKWRSQQWLAMAAAATVFAVWLALLTAS